MTGLAEEPQRGRFTGPVAGLAVAKQRPGRPAFGFIRPLLDEIEFGEQVERHALLYSVAGDTARFDRPQGSLAGLDGVTQVHERRRAAPHGVDPEVPPAPFGEFEDPVV